MTKRILVLGGYGNFGRFICQELATDPNIQLLVAGRSMEKAKAFVETLPASGGPSPIQLDVGEGLEQTLLTLQPDIVINTVGPFQNQSYVVPKACINAGSHYLDLADGREFVANIGDLNSAAISKGVSVVSGASSVPALSAAVIDQFMPRFIRLESIDYGISTAQHTTRGLATTQAVLSYAGKPIRTAFGDAEKPVFGWQGIRAHKFNGLGRRWLSYCDVPDLSLFPERYPSLRSIRFYAGVELAVQQWGVWILSWLVRAGMVKDLSSWANPLLKTSFLFDRLGGDESGIFMTLNGRGEHDTPKSVTFELVARSGHGPLIPCMPAIVLAKRLAAGKELKAGAYPCVGLISLDQYLDALKNLDIHWTEGEAA
ncbi:MAG: saccharopine dehydrogenase NADP-binding domain-containing protein [Kordiimonadaceae bacterium]|nr:saccharopine dehydrogenase NADP-binding domain-containing protein [Kordiimonadaceae bacterium]MBO6567128.1 saccharopine dehydrogenase NADP-binding domain-containing protein [Kordiimonadaceae bacterium]MBO6963657.1 saccharopine dehydrogenase NADP-binding domain-containing protein [Kordiimonadaceae bacterium]